jgi:hypothetical protein
MAAAPGAAADRFDENREHDPESGDPFSEWSFSFLSL